MNGDGQWMRAAACRGQDPDRFFPEESAQTRQAVAVCDDCRVRTECLNYAIRIGPVDGVWGGTTARQRRQMRDTATVGGAQ